MFVENIVWGKMLTVACIKINWWKVGVVVHSVPSSWNNLFLSFSLFNFLLNVLMFLSVITLYMKSCLFLIVFFSQTKYLLNIYHVPDTMLGASDHPAAIEQTWILFWWNLQPGGGRTIYLFTLLWLLVHSSAFLLSCFTLWYSYGLCILLEYNFLLVRVYHAFSVSPVPNIPLGIEWTK